MYVSSMKPEREAARVDRLIARALAALPAGRYLLAVSGGRDSMVLLDAVVRTRTDAVAVATFDHGTGRAARRAALLVEFEAQRRGMRVVSGRHRGANPGTEQAWRAARWEFLRGHAQQFGATVVTAHTRDDQLETVVMRLLRDQRHASARGLAAMYAPSPIARPLIEVPRSAVAEYARAHDVRFVEDPTNESPSHFRNRIRRDLLPAVERIRPGFGRSMLALSRRAAAWRAEVEALVDALGVDHSPTVVVAAGTITCIPPEGLAILWPAIAGRAGVALDWRGTERLVAFTAQAKAGGQVPLSGGARVERTPSSFVLRA